MAMVLTNMFVWAVGRVRVFAAYAPLRLLILERATQPTLFSTFLAYAPSFLSFCPVPCAHVHRTSTELHSVLIRFWDVA